MTTRRINLTNGTGRAVVRVLGTSFSQHKQINQWLDGNFTSVSSIKSGKIVPRAYLGTGGAGQPNGFSLARSKIVAALVDTSWNDWNMSGSRGHSVTPTDTFTPLEVRWTGSSDYLGSWTQLPELCFKQLGEPLDFTSSKVFTGYSCKDAFASIKAHRGSARNDLIKIMEHAIWMDTIGTVSLFGNDEKLKVAFDLLAPKKMQGILIDKLYRGNGDVSLKVQTVTKKQVKEGKAFFLYKANAPIVDQANSSTQTSTYVALGSFLDWDTILRFKKTRKFFLDMLDAIEHSPERIFDKMTYEDIISQKASQFTKYWTGIIDILDFHNTQEQPDIYDIVDQTIKSGDHVDNQTMRALNAKSTVNNSKAGKRYKTLEGAVSNIKQQAEELAKKIADEKRKVTVLQTDIEENQRDLELFKQQVKDLEAQITKLEAEIPAKQAAVDKLTDTKKELAKETIEVVGQLSEAQREYNAALKEFMNNKDGPNYFNNWLKSGIVIRKMIFISEDGRKADIRKMPEVAVADGWKLQHLELITTRPTAIYVDRQEKGDKAVAVAGGPYEVMVSIQKNGNPEMALRLASHNSIFGKQKFGNEWNAKPHPHTDDTLVYNDMDSVTEFIHSWKNCCLGEVQGLIQQGMDQNNPKVVIAAVLSWLSSAYSEDGWGETWDWFPLVEEVYMGSEDEIPTEEPEPEPVIKAEDIKIPDVSDVIRELKSNLENRAEAVPA